MGLYQYEYLVKRKKKKFWVQAESLEEAKLLLVKKNVLVLQIYPFQRKKNLSLSPSSLLFFTRELSKLLKAGLPLLEALFSLEEKYQKGNLHLLLLDIKDQVKGGKFLSEAMQGYPQIFDSFYLCMIQSGEKRGALIEALEGAYQVIHKQQVLKKQIISALIYPGILLSFCGIVLVSLLFYVIPSLAELFEGRKIEGLTWFVLHLSTWAVYYQRELVFFFFFLFFGVIALKRTVLFQKKAQKLVQNFLFFRNFFRKVALLRFCKALSFLLQGGVSLLEGIRFAKGLMNHDVLEKSMEGIEKGILEGNRFSEELKKNRYIPSLLVRLIALSEQGGGVAIMLDYLCTIYEEEIERSLSRFSILLQPILLLILGAIVGGVLLAVLLPLTDISSFGESF